MENDKRTHQHEGSPTSLASEVAHKAEDRLEDTTQQYLDKAGVGVSCVSDGDLVSENRVVHGRWVSA